MGKAFSTVVPGDRDIISRTVSAKFGSIILAGTPDVVFGFWGGGDGRWIEV